jgi:hypothetical protein
VDVAQESIVQINQKNCSVATWQSWFYWWSKSWTTAKIIEECLKFKSKMILLDVLVNIETLKMNLLSMFI